jgi:hypothetical protein
MSQLQETMQLSFTNTGDNYQTFGLDIPPLGIGSGVQKIILRASADCYIDFDRPAATGSSMLIKAADGHLETLDFSGGSVMTVHARGTSGSGTLYIVGIRT